MGDPQKGIENWRNMNIDRLSLLQQGGHVRDDVAPEDLLAAIGALAVGAGTRLMGNPSKESAERELRMIDAFIDSLGPSEGS